MSRSSTTRLAGRKLLAMLAALCLLVTAFPVVSFASLRAETYPAAGLKYQAEEAPYIDVFDDNDLYLEEDLDYTILFGLSAGACNQTRDEFAETVATLPKGNVTIYYTITGIGTYAGQSQSGSFTTFVAEHCLRNYGNAYQVVLVGNGVFSEPFILDRFGYRIATGDLKYGTTSASYPMTYDQAVAYLAGLSQGTYVLYYQFTGTGDYAGETYEDELQIEISDIKLEDRTTEEQNAVPYVGTFPGVDVFDLGHNCVPTGTVTYSLTGDDNSFTLSYTDVKNHLADLNPGDNENLYYLFTGTGTYSGKSVDGYIYISVTDSVMSNNDMINNTDLLQTVRYGDGTFNPLSLSAWAEASPNNWTIVRLTGDNGVTTYGPSADNCTLTYDQAVALLASQPSGTIYKLYYAFAGTGAYSAYTATGAIYAQISDCGFTNENDMYQTVLEGVGDFTEPSLWDRYNYEYGVGDFTYGTSRSTCTMTYAQAKAYLAGLAKKTELYLWYTFTGTGTFAGVTYTDRLHITVSDILLEDRTLPDQIVKPGVGTFEPASFYDLGYDQDATGNVTYGENNWTYAEMVAYLATLEAGDFYQFYYNFNGTGIYRGQMKGGWIFVYLTDSVTTDRLEDYTELKQYVKAGVGDFEGVYLSGQPDPNDYMWREINDGDGTLLYGTAEGTYTMTYDQTVTYLAGLTAGTVVDLYYCFTGTGDFAGESATGKLTVKLCNYRLVLTSSFTYTVAQGKGTFDDPELGDDFGSGVTVTGTFAYGTEKGTYNMTHAQAEAYLATLAPDDDYYPLFFQFTGSGDTAGETCEDELYFQVVDMIIVDRTITRQHVKPGVGTFVGANVYDEAGQIVPTFSVAYGTEWNHLTMTYDQAVAYLAGLYEGASADLYYQISGTGAYAGRIDESGYIEFAVTNKVTSDGLSDGTDIFQPIKTGTNDFYGAYICDTDTWTLVSNDDTYGTTLYGTAEDNLTMTYSEAVAYCAALPDMSNVTLYYGFTGTGTLAGESATGLIAVRVSSIDLWINTNDRDQRVKTGVGTFREPGISTDTYSDLTGSYLYGLSPISCTMTYAEAVAYLASRNNYDNVTLWFTFTADTAGYVGRQLTTYVNIEVMAYNLTSDVPYSQSVLYGDGTFTGVTMTDLFINAAPTGTVLYGLSEGSYTMTYDDTKSYLASLDADTSLIIYWQFTGTGIYTTRWTSSFNVTVAEPRSMADVTVYFYNTDRYPNEFIYTGTAIEPDASLYYNGMYLTEGVDYTVTYTNNVNVGTATATFQGKGVYSGTLTEDFVIYQRTLLTAAGVDNANLTVVAGDSPVLTGESNSPWQVTFIGEGYESADGTVGIFGDRYYGIDDSYCDAHYLSRLTAFDSSTSYYYVAVFCPYYSSDYCLSATGGTTVTINGTDYTYNDGVADFSMDGDNLVVKIPMTLIPANDPSVHAVTFTDAESNVLRTLHVADGTLFGDVQKPEFPNSYYYYNCDSTYYYYGWQTANGTLMDDNDAITADLTVTYAREYLLPVAVGSGLDIAPVTDTELIRNVPTGLTVADMKALLQNNPATMTFKQYDENYGSWEPLDDTDPIGTGTIVTIESAYDGSYLSEYTLVVPGDVTGDGLANSDDYNELKALILENDTCYLYTKSWSVAYEYGVDFNGDQILDVLDLRAMKRLLA